jgi:hypothetical protein
VSRSIRSWREVNARALDVVESRGQGLDDQGPLALFDHITLGILDQEAVDALDGPITFGEFGVVEEGGFEVGDLVDGVETIGNDNPQVDVVMLSLGPSPELAIGHFGDGAFDPVLGLLAVAGDDATGERGFEIAAVGADGFGSLGAVGLDVVQGELEKVVADGVPFLAVDWALDCVRFEDSELIRGPFWWSGLCRGGSGGFQM